MKTILPIEKKPMIRSYLHYAFPLSVIMIEPYYNNWLLNNFIQLIYDETNSCLLDFHEPLYNWWPCLNVCRLYKTHFDRHSLSPITYLCREIHDRTYAAAWIDMYYIKGHSFYGKEHRQHGALLYGADDEACCFYAMLYNEDSSYTEAVIPFDMFLEGYHGPCGEWQAVYIDFLTINYDACVDYHFYSIQHKLRCYLESKNYDVDNLKYHKNISITDYGVAACHRLREHIEGAAAAGEIDRRFVSVFYEHKKCMMFRIKMILEEYPLAHYPFTEKQREALADSAYRVVMLSLKYNLTKNAATLKRIVALIDEILETEKAMLLPLVHFEREPATVLLRRDGKVCYKPLQLI